jgi:hypothetical protein
MAAQDHKAIPRRFFEAADRLLAEGYIVQADRDAYVSLGRREPDREVAGSGRTRCRNIAAAAGTSLRERPSTEPGSRIHQRQSIFSGSLRVPENLILQMAGRCPPNERSCASPDRGAERDAWPKALLVRATDGRPDGDFGDDDRGSSSGAIRERSTGRTAAPGKWRLCGSARALEQDRLRAAYGGNADRLRQVKATYDPDNFFRRNHNIEPLSRTFA